MKLTRNNYVIHYTWLIPSPATRYIMRLDVKCISYWLVSFSMWNLFVLLCSVCDVSLKNVITYIRVRCVYIVSYSLCTLVLYELNSSCSNCKSRYQISVNTAKSNTSTSHYLLTTVMCSWVYLGILLYC